MSKILVAGAGKGIGNAVSHLLHSEGHKVIAISRNPVDLDNLPFNNHEMDLMDPDSTPLLKQFSVSNLPDIVINCTGTHPGFRYGGGELEIVKQTLNSNTRPAANLHQAYFEAFKERGYGHFIHLSSIALNSHGINEAAYCASKAALESMVTCFANEDQNIRHNLVRIGLTDTPLARRVVPVDAGVDWSKVYTPQETARIIGDIVANPTEYELVVKVPEKPNR